MAEGRRRHHLPIPHAQLPGTDYVTTFRRLTALVSSLDSDTRLGSDVARRLRADFTTFGVDDFSTFGVDSGTGSSTGIVSSPPELKETT